MKALGDIWLADMDCICRHLGRPLCAQEHAQLGIRLVFFEYQPMKQTRSATRFLALKEETGLRQGRMLLSGIPAAPQSTRSPCQCLFKDI
jgi:hypothetical protein